jgi:hypothetical protein
VEDKQALSRVGDDDDDDDDDRIGLQDTQALWDAFLCNTVSEANVVIVESCTPSRRTHESSDSRGEYPT